MEFLFLGVFLMVVIAMCFFVNGPAKGKPNKKVHMKRISFSVDLKNYYSLTAFGAVHGYKCLLCQKETIDYKRVITHLNHDHMDKEFMYKVKLDD